VTSHVGVELMPVSMVTMVMVAPQVEGVKATVGSGIVVSVGAGSGRLVAR